MPFGLSYRTLFITGLILAALYGLTRLTHLTALPIFTDEAIYIRWSQIGSRDASWRFISLTDGKQPLYTWAAMILLRVIPDPLTAGRMVSVIAGFFTLAAVWLVSFELFRSRKISLYASLLYIFSPFCLMYDRLALYDSLVASLYMWSLYLSILLVRTVRLDAALLLGISLGLGVLNKSSGLLSLYLQPTLLILLDRSNARKKYQLPRWLGLVGIASVLAMAIYSILRLSPFYAMVSQKDAVFLYSLSEVFSHPVSIPYGNFRGLFDWLSAYMTYPLFFVSILALVFSRKDMKQKILLYCWWFLPFAALAIFGKVLYPRFILFMSMPLVILAATSLDWVQQKFKGTLFGTILLLALVFPSIRAVYYIITNPVYAPIPFADRGQLIDDWPSGWGVKEVNAFLREKAGEGKVTVFTEGTFGLLPFAVEIYLVDVPGVTIHGLWPVGGPMPAEITENALDHPTYLILNESQSAPPGWPLRLISEYKKGRNPDSKLRLFQVMPVPPDKINRGIPN